MKKLLLSTLLMANGIAVATPFVVQDIRVDGIQPDAGSSLISSLPIKIGQKATDNDIANVVRQIFLQNRFQDVSADREGNTLVIKVVEFPVINNVSIEGNSAIPKEPLKENLKANLISRGEVFDAEKLESFKDALLEHYHSIGRYNAKIDSEVTQADSGSVNIKLIIKEDEISYVKTITFEGNNSFDSDELLDQLDIQPDVKWWNIFSSSKFEQPVYKQDIENLRNFYMNRGYAKFNIENSDVSFSNDQKEVYLTYKINEGNQYNISEIQIIGDTANMDNELNKVLDGFEPGQQFRRSELIKIEDDIKDILGNNGFASAKVEIYPVFDDKNNTVRINYVVEAGKRIYVRKIRFEGNTVTADSTLRREMRQQEGAWLSTNLAQLGKSRLDRTGFYESVDVSYPKVEQSDDQADLVYKVKERNTGSINFGIGYGTESGLSYQAGIKQDNFLGMGSTISLNGSRNDYGTTVSLGYTEPYFTKDGVSLGGNVFYEDYDNSRNDNVSSYKRQTYGVSGTLGFPVDENNSYYLGLGYTHDKIKNAQREFNRDLYVRSIGIDIPPGSINYPKIKADDFDFSFGWNYNSLDRGYLPTEGTTANIGGRITIPGSDNKYYKLSAGFKNYYPLNRDHSWIIQTGADIAYANGIGDKRLPFYQNYTAGGIGSLRGFGYGAIGPKAIYADYSSKAKRTSNGDFIFNRLSDDVIGGNAMATASLELITPTPFIDDKYQNNVRTSIFVDAGSVWNTKWDKSIYPNAVDFGDYKRIRSSAGISFQWNSPIGPLLFSYAKPIKKYEGDEIEQFQFSIGGTF
ncbi:outer membrane protein assembly factor BamA [Otariodibacter sp.]|uniref:outer membrane protein assembly factor BamA n=1 Tax=Otariodibacter sp. TaxID=3030919 RepID=UPI0026133679|nr:outer membrane protein assembly factor BamA [Otariodibacter sp.]